MLKIDYKGKYFILQDKVIEEGWDFVVGEISKKEAMKPEFVKDHKRHSIYYGIPAYIGEDKNLNKIFN